MNPPDKTCLNCRYFVQHYQIRRTRYVPAICGYCACRGLTSRKKSKPPIKIDCPKWEPMELQLDERRQNIIEALLDMDEKLKIISAILLDDEKIRKQLTDD